MAVDTTSLLNDDYDDDDVNIDVENKCFYNSIMISPINNQNKTTKFDGDIIVVTPNHRSDNFFKKSLWMKGMIIISIAVVVVLGFVVTYHSTATSFIIGDNNSNNPSSSITASVDMVGSSSRKGVKGCNIASTTYVDNGKRTVDTNNPFQLCFQFGNTDSFCWSKSVYTTYFFGNGDWLGCYPCGWSDGILATHWHGTSGRGNNNCGSPCTEFCPAISGKGKAKFI